VLCAASAHLRLLTKQGEEPYNTPEMDDQVHIRVLPHYGAGLPAIDTTFPRVTVILGANGTGKSRLLQLFPGVFYQAFKREHHQMLRIAGGRAITPPPRIVLDRDTVDRFGTIAQAQESYFQSRSADADARLRDALQLLHSIGEDRKAQHSDAVMEWLARESVGPCPVRSPQPLEQLTELFALMFPGMVLLRKEDGQLECQKNGASYSVVEMSDGEKQVLYLLTEIALASQPDGVFIVDEPELNLNANLASKLWDLLESRLPDATFVYATHSVAFAMRSTVQKIIVLSQSGQSPVEVANISAIPPTELREFLGAVPSILAAPAALAVEGKDTSFDSPFYRWLIGRDDVAIVPMEDCHGVIAATTRTGIWDRLAPAARIGGVIDRDVRTDEELKSYGSKCTVLDFREAEAYFCHPEVVSAVSRAIKTAPTPTEAEVTAIIADALRPIIHRVAATRAGRRAQITLTITPEGCVLDKLRTESQVREVISRRVREQAEVMKERVSEQAAQDSYTEELQRCHDALNGGRVAELLQLTPAKGVLPKIAQRLGLTEDAYCNAVVNNLDPTELSCLEALRASLHGVLRL
jgi:energy-coupling factor transporter ATP-binding protein EcfA2